MNDIKKREPQDENVPMAGPPIVLRAHPGTPPPMSETRASADVGMLLKAFSRRWRLAMASGLLLAGLAGTGTWFLMPEAKYTAQTTLLVATHRPRVIFETAERQSDYRTYQKTQENLVRSRTVLNAALKRPDVTRLPSVRHGEDPIGMLERELKVEFPGGSEMLRISLSGNRPDDVAGLTNAVTMAYLACVDDLDRKARLDRFEKLQKLYREYQADMEKRRKALRELAEHVGSDDRKILAHEHELELERLGLIRSEATQLRAQVRRSRAEVACLEAEADEAEGLPIAPNEVSNLVNSQPAIHADLAKIDGIRARIQQTEGLVRKKASDPATIRLYADLKLAEQAYQERIKRFTIDITARLRERNVEQSRKKLGEARQRLAILQGQAAEVDQEAEGIQVTARGLSIGAMDIQVHQDDLRLKEESSKKVGAEVSALEVEVQAAPRIMPLDWAEVPKVKDQSRALKITGMTTALSFLGALAGVVVWEFRQRRVTSFDEVVREVGLPMVGTLPVRSRRNDRVTNVEASGPDRRWRSTMIESIDATRTLILHAARTEGLRTIMVTSAVGGEGKTTLSTCLAASLARAGRRTILVDCDLRRPTVQALFDVPLKPGLCEVLRGEAALDDVIVSGDFAGSPVGFWVIPAGECDPSALQMLALDKYHALCEQLKESFDFVVSDSAPVLPVADSLLIGQQIDAVIFSIRESYSRVPLVSMAYRRMEALGVRMLGAVIHGGTQYRYGYDCRYNGESQT